MTKYYHVTCPTTLKQLKERDAYEEAMVEAFRTFSAQHGISAIGLNICKMDQLIIRSNPEDREKFKGSLLKHEMGDCLFFRQNSMINKQWKEHLKAAHVAFAPPILLHMVFPCGLGRTTWQFYEMDGEIYVVITSSELGVRDGFTELKASEFHKIREDFEERLKANGEAANDVC